MIRSRGLIGLVAMAAVLTGCTVNGPDPAPSEPEPTSGSGSLQLPPRPKELPIAGAQDAAVCTWLSSEQQSQLQVSRPKPAVKNGNNYNGCAYTPDGTGVSTGVAVRVVPEGLEPFMAKMPGSQPTQAINGFGAVQSQVPGAEGLGCAVLVDAAEGQTLYVDLTLLSPGALNNQQMCDKAKQAAQATVTTLQGKS